MSTAYLTDLPKAATFVGPDGDTYEVITPASVNGRGRVDVRSRTRPADEDGFFQYSTPVEVELLSLP